jgi:hypothetical protein
MSRRKKAKQSDNEIPSVLKVFGPIDDDEEKRRKRKVRYYKKLKNTKEIRTATENSIRAILTPMGNKR